MRAPIMFSGSQALFFAVVGLTLAGIPSPGGEDKGGKTWTVALADGARDTHTIEPKKDALVQVILTGTKKSDVDLFVYDPEGKEVGKDVSIGPDGFVTFKATRQGKYRVELSNLGPGQNTSTVLVDSVPEPPTVWSVQMPAGRQYTRAVLLKQGSNIVVKLTGKNKKCDVHLIAIFENLPVARDDSPGPDGKVEFTAKETGVYRFVIKNVSKNEADVSTVAVRAKGGSDSTRESRLSGPAHGMMIIDRRR